MSAMRGIAVSGLMVAMAAAASPSGTATRTSWQPHRSRRRICSTVAMASRVSVLVIDCTTTGAPPPTVTPPMSMGFDILRLITAGSSPRSAGARYRSG